MDLLEYSKFWEAIRHRYSRATPKPALISNMQPYLVVNFMIKFSDRIV